MDSFLQNLKRATFLRHTVYVECIYVQGGPKK